MKITEHMRDKIVRALRAKGIKKKEIAECVGLGNAWVTKLLDSSSEGLKDLKIDHAAKLEELLNIRLIEIVDVDTIRTPLEQSIADLIEASPESEKALETLVGLLRLQNYNLPFIPTKDLMDFGNEIMRAAHEDPDKPGKVARIAIEWLAKRLEKLGQ